MKFVLFVSLLGSSAFASAPLKVRCLSAAGYYGGFTAIESRGQVQIRVKGGLGLNPSQFLEDLGIPQTPDKFVGEFTAVLDANDCRVAPSDPFRARCRARRTVLDLGQLGSVTVSQFGVELQHVGSKVRVSVSALRNGDAARTAQVFQAPPGPAHSSCVALP
jgi:hypothetical protein